MGQNYVSYYDMERIAREIRGMRGAGNGVAPLDESGHVPAANLPSYVDDVLEYATQSAFPTAGESGKIYIAQDTNLTYRWSGTQYVEISQSIALGETASTAYPGDKGSKNADEISALSKEQSSLKSSISSLESRVSSVETKTSNFRTSERYSNEKRQLYVDVTGFLLNSCTMYPLFIGARNGQGGILMIGTTDGAALASNCVMYWLSKIYPEFSIAGVSLLNNGFRIFVNQRQYNTFSITPLFATTTSCAINDVAAGTWAEGAYDMAVSEILLNEGAGDSAGIADDFDHNVPRKTPKDITAYYTDGSLWNRIAGTGGYALFEDIYVGDYFKMSRAVSAYERTGTYQTTGSQYVTIAGIDTMWGNGDDSGVSYHHLVMVPGQGFGGTQHFGRARMNPSNVTTGGYKSSEMFTETIGAVTTSGSTAGTATINQQLYAEFGSHLKTTRELVSSSVNASGYNRFGAASGCSNSWTWVDAQAVLMSEVEVYGSVVFSSSGYDTGNANTRLPLFAYSKQAVNNRSAYYWLKDVASGAYFCYASSDGHAGCNDASYARYYVRPRFILAA